MNDRGDVAYLPSLAAQEAAYWEAQRQGMNLTDKQIGEPKTRARRYAVKLFLAHLHHVMYESRYGETPPKPYILSQPGHAHFIAPPNWPL